MPSSISEAVAAYALLFSWVLGAFYHRDVGNSLWIGLC